MGFTAAATRPKKYNIVRYWANGRSMIQKRGLSLEEAQAHCRDPKTHEKGVWFDGYTEAKR